MVMVESTAEVGLMYRGFVIEVHAKKDSSGEKSIFTYINYHVPELKPRYADYVDEREMVETQEGEVECMRTYDTIGPIEADRLTVSKFYRPSDEDEGGNFIPSWVPVIGGSGKDDPEPAISNMVCEAVLEVQDNIDEYIEAHSLVEVSKEEVLHGLEQSVSKPIDGVEVSTPEMNTDASYDDVRPSEGEIARELDCSD